MTPPPTGTLTPGQDCCMNCGKVTRQLFGGYCIDCDIAATIPPQDRIVVALADDHWVCVLFAGDIITDDAETLAQARANCAQWDADPATCIIVDARETQWRWVRNVTWEALLAREEEGEEE